MTPSWDTALAFSAVPEVGALLLSSEPAVIWARDGARVLWANPAGAARVGASNFAALAERRWAEGHQLRRAIAGLARALPEAGTLARLRLTDDLPALPAACRCAYVRAGEVRGVLVTVLDGKEPSTTEAALAAFFSSGETGAVVLDSDGAALAENPPGVAEARSYASLSVEFKQGGSPLQLVLIDLVAAPIGRGAFPGTPAAPPTERFPEMESPEAQTDESARPEPPVKVGPVFQEERPLWKKHAEPPAKREPMEDRQLEAKPDVVPEQQRGAPEPEPKPHREEPEERTVMAGRVDRELSRAPVRFLWQTDTDDRYLFVSPGLAQVVGRNAEIVGERWQDAAMRLRLDPAARITRALRQRDTWSGLTAWWPVEGSEVRVPVELTALPVFGVDQSFQGYRGFGILRPAEALMPAAFEARFGSEPTPQELQQPPYEEAVADAPANVVPIRADLEHAVEHARLSPQERMAFEEIAAALKSRVVSDPHDVDDIAPEVPDVARSRAENEPQHEPPAPRQPAVDLMPREDDRPAAEPAPKARSRRAEVRVPADAVSARAPLRTADRSDPEQRLSEMIAILDTATDGVIVLDGYGVVESVNASAEALFGLRARDMEGRPFENLLTAESRQLASDYLSGLKDSGVASLLNEGREVAASAGPGSIPLFMTMGRISSEEGGRFCAVLRDITHWKRIEAELRQAKQVAEEASKQKSEFLARVSHELRTPLNAIIGFAEVMIEERFGPVNHERYREYLRDIRTSGEHVVSLVNDLLDISKIEAGKLDLDFTAVPLNELVRECIGLMQPQANRAHVVLRSSLSREVPAVVADERTMRQIVLNLLSNSVKFTDPGGQVIASTSLSESGEAILRVRDTGEGMSEDQLARALEPFRQLSTAAIGDASGSGLGLPLTKALVEANRASLSIRSKPGEGTVVSVTIPPTRVLSE